MLKTILLLGGTYEGRSLAQFLAGFPVHVTVSVATAYGEELLSDAENISVSRKRLDLSGMRSLIASISADLVIDATHPYAVLVSETAKKACELENVPLLRIERPSITENACCQNQIQDPPASRLSPEHLIRVSSISEAACFLNQTEGSILVTTGSKNLSDYAGISHAIERIYARVLPTAEAIEACRNFGLPGSHILAMQGPFSVEMNLAMLHYTDARYLVTKNSGKAGGFLEKLSAAGQCPVTTVIIEPPDRREREKITASRLKDAVNSPRSFCEYYGNYEEAVEALKLTICPY